MTTVQQILSFIDQWAPFHTQLPYDNSGLLVGDGQAAVTGITVALDITRQTVLFADEHKDNLIVSHHPVIFHPLKTIHQGSPVWELAHRGIHALCAHTNLDAASGGVSDHLAQLLTLQVTGTIADPEFPAQPPTARIGKLPQALSCDQFAAFVQQTLSCGGLRYTSIGRPIQTVAVCGGAGGDFLLPAQQAGADVLVTGDIRHHEWLLAQEYNMMLIDAGHFATEYPIVAVLARRLQETFPTVPVHIGEQQDPVQYR